MRVRARATLPMDRLESVTARRQRLSGGRRGGRRRVGQHGDRSGSLVAAFLVGALPGDAGALQILLDHVVRAARRAWLQHDLVPCGELALRVAAAAEENFPAAAATLEDLAFLAFRARDSGLDRVGLQALDAVAIRVARASEEFAEARAAFDHRLAALFADLVGGRRRRRLQRDDALFVARDFAGVGAFGIVRAGEKLAVAAPVDHHVAAVELALETGGQALVLDLGHFLFRVGEVLRERAVEALHRLDPVLGTLFDLVEVLFELRREAGFQNVGERLDQHVVDDAPERRRPHPLALVLFDVLDAQDARHDCGVGRRTPDTLLLEFFDQRGLRVARRRLREMLFGIEPEQGESLALVQQRQRAFLVVGRRFVLTLDIHAHETVELHHLAGRTENRVGRLDIDRGAVVHRLRHLARDEAIVDERVERECVLVEVARDRLGVALDGGRANCFMRALRLLAGFIKVRLIGNIFFAVTRDDMVADGLERLVRHARRIGAHISDEADRALLAKLDALVQLLRDLHRAPRLIVQLARRLLLQAPRDRDPRSGLGRPILLALSITLGLFKGTYRTYRSRMYVTDLKRLNSYSA